MTSPTVPTVGLAEAARLTGKSISTIRRKKRELCEFGATVSAAGWAIPIPALVHLGLLDRLPPSMIDPLVAAFTAHIADLQAQLDRERARADNLETRLDQLLQSERPGLFSRLLKQS